MSLSIHRRVAKNSLQFDAALHPLLRRIYASRALQDQRELRLEMDQLLAPDTFKGMTAAVDLLLQELMHEGRVLIVSDFDADGATSCVLAVSALRALGFAHVDYIVPNRFEYGYGLTPEIVQLALHKNPTLIITVDNGISSIEGVRAAQAAGVKVLVTDHHLPGRELPGADAIVNPNQPGCTFASKAIAGVGVVFYLMLALRSRLREQNWFSAQNIPEPKLADLLDLVALGTVADVVPLDYNNRILVNEGLKRIRAGRTRPGMLALLDIGKRQLPNLVAADLGFAVGPRLNAAGRLDDMSLGIECLLTEAPAAAWAMAVKLDALNNERKLIEGEMRDQAFAGLQAIDLSSTDLPAGVCVYHESWHQGVIGILASRIKDKYHRPVIAFADASSGGGEEAEIKGSARSIPGYHIRDALDTIASRYPQLIQKFGGHAMAAGLSLKRSDLEAFSHAFAEHAAATLSEDELTARLLSDGAIDADDLTMQTAQAIQAGGPWGQGFPEPLFDGEFVVRDQRLLAQKHLKMQVSPAGSQLTLDAIAFNVDIRLWPQTVRTVHLAYRLSVNEYRGNRSLQLVVEQLESL